MSNRRNYRHHNFFPLCHSPPYFRDQMSRGYKNQVLQDVRRKINSCNLRKTNKKCILGFLLHQQSLKSPVSNDIVNDIILNWVFCNVYTKTRPTVKKYLEDLRKEFKYLKGRDKSKRNSTYYNTARLSLINVIPSLI